jgi:hypothetical protein
MAPGLLLLACSGYDRSPILSVRDSSGVVIIESRSTVIDSALIWHVDSVPELQLGAALADGPTSFSGIEGIAQLTNGELVVLDRSTQEVRFFSAQGAIVRRVGRRGAGPGEFGDFMLVPDVSYDSLIIMDPANLRISVLSSDGAFLSSFSVGNSVGEPRGILSGFRIAGSSGFYSRGSEGLSYNITAFVVVNPVSDLRDTIAVDTAGMVTARGRADNISYPAFVPFMGRSSIAVGRGKVYYTSGKTQEILEFDESLQLTMRMRALNEQQRVTAKLFDSAVGRYADRMSNPQRVRTLFSQLPRPQFLPVWTRLIVDWRGSIWAEEYRPVRSTASTWIIFDPSGAIRGAARMPANFTVAQIGESFVLGVWRDADGVEYVRRHRLVRQR